VHNNRCSNIGGQSVKQKEVEAQIPEFMYRDKTNVEHEMYDSAANDGGQRKSDKRPKQKFGNHTVKT
jgi:hypothetical protein